MLQQIISKFAIALVLLTLTACDDEKTVEEKKAITVEAEDDEIKTVNETLAPGVESISPNIKEPSLAMPDSVEGSDGISLGQRPHSLVADMKVSPLKKLLESCSEKEFYRTDFSISHRGAPLQFPEHTRESYMAAANMGAGIVECDVTFTKDKELVCRHSQCDLHTTTNILTIPELANKCTTPFTPANASEGTSASAKCCTSDISVAEFLTLKGKMDTANTHALSPEEYLETALPSNSESNIQFGTLMTHKQSIELFKSLDVKMIPELKAPMVKMPFDGFTQQQYVHKIIEEYENANVPQDHIYLQSFSLTDIRSWISSSPDLAGRIVYLDGRVNGAEFDAMDSETWIPSMTKLHEMGLRIIAPPIWVALTLDKDSKIVPSEYAIQAKAAGLEIIAWSFERSGTLENGGGYYYQSITDAISDDSDMYTVIDVLAKDVGVMGVFSDWPATVSYYASCMNMAKSE
ncbi:glycerophosphodiester phosphodiesterase family protein [Pseudoalteromonas atlantica]|uniref:glycerophosphodiester phosphodiesterase family protein n=1 Tax=Pseudoalteromonas atlantica TaxID=288 RepID=UPI003735E2A0